MNKLILAGAALAVASVMAGAANAADMPLKAPVYAPAFTWTGVYLGVNAGYGWMDTTGDNFCTNPFGVVNGNGCQPASSGAVDPKGGFVGGTLGLNYQTGAFVWGVETDIQVSGVSNSTAAIAIPCCIGVPGAGTTPLTRAVNMDWFGTVRGRLGYALWDRALIYGTGGVMYAEEKTNSLLIAAAPYQANSDSTRTGWVAGAGLEYAFTNNLSAKIEGLFFDLGSETIAVKSPVFGFAETTNFKYSGELVRIGLNVKFGS